MKINHLFKGIYSGKKVFITGHTGFKGSWLSLWLSLLGADVTGFSLKPEYAPDHFSLLNIKMTSIIGDIRNKEILFDAIHAFNPDIVFHLAAQPLVRKSYNIPHETFETNIMGTVYMLEACRNSKSIKAIINITSDKCYENKDLQYSFKESDPVGGFDPYSASKGCAELITSSYRNSFFNIRDYGKEHDVLLASCRAGNVIGGGDWSEDRLIPDIVRSASKKEIINIRNPHAVRPWQHVLEPLSGYLLLGQKLLEGKPEFAEAWNFGPRNEDNISVKEVAEIAKLFWDDINYNQETALSNNQPHESSYLTLDCSKANGKLNWNEVWNIETAIEKTINWYKLFYSKNEISTENDIADYIEEATNKDLVWTSLPDYCSFNKTLKPINRQGRNMPL